MSLRVDTLDVSIGAAAILRGVDLAITPGTLCGLIGRNGAGKTTLMRAVMGFLPPRRGSIRFGATSPARPRIAAPSSASATCRRTASSSPISR
jgi:ABC-type branched-subunit amino acid transport system ATPase component